MQKMKAPPPVADINVTPMVDVMLVMLIIFMVITPMLSKGVTVDLVKTKNPIAMQAADKEDAVLVAVTMRLARLRPAAVTVLALVFEVVSSYGIAAAEFLQPMTFNRNSNWIGHSWVSVWVLLFNIVVPTVPRYAVIAALASVSSVPAMVRLSTSLFPLNPPPTDAMPVETVRKITGAMIILTRSMKPLPSGWSLTPTSGQK